MKMNNTNDRREIRQMVTIKDVAAAAGVSVGTVSRVINNLSVKEDNRVKTEVAIKKLGYEVNTYARGFKMQQTFTVAMIVPDLINPFFALLVNYAEQILADIGYKLLICNSYGNAERESAYITIAKQNKVDGMLVLTYCQNGKDLEEAGIPIVSFDRHYKHPIFCVSADNSQGGRLAAEKLIETGCKRVIYIRNGSNLEGETLKRGKAFMDTCASSGVEAVRMDFGEETTLDQEQIAKIYTFLEQNVKNDKFEYDGIFTSSDIHAVMIVKKLKEMGIRVPEEVQVIGYDGLRILNVGDYPVSSISQPIKEMAKVSVEILIKMINKEEITGDIILPVCFVEGGTTK